MKIMSLPVDDGGCGWYRVRQPFEMIMKYTDHDTHIIDKEKDNMVAVAEAVKHTDIMVVRQGGEIGIPFFADKVEYHHLKWVLDIDDNCEIISPYSEHYRDYGTKEIIYNGKWLWQNGKNGFDMEGNKKKLERLRWAMETVDMVTVTTEKLAKYARRYNENVVVLPNCVDTNIWWQLPLKENKQLRVGWSGGASHYEDWYSIKEPLNELMRELQFKLVLVGDNFEGIVDDDNKHLVETHPWVPFKGHSYRMMCMNLDLAIIPLADLPFNHYKSSIKFYEMSAMGVPSVVSDVLPYSEDIKGIAWGYKTPDEFKSCVLEALATPSNLKVMGKKALDWVLENKSGKNNVDKWINAYKSLL